MNDNLPDDCQGNGEHLPWNEVVIERCYCCEDVIQEDENHNLIRTERGAEAYVCDYCLSELGDELEVID